MGGSASRPELPTAPAFDISNATVSLPTVQQFEQRAQAAVNEATAAAESLYQQNSWIYTVIRYSLILAVIVVLAGVGYFYVYPWVDGLIKKTPASTPDISGKTLLGSGSSAPSSGGNLLKIKSAKLSTGENVTEKLFRLQNVDSLSVTVDETIGAKKGSALNVDYEYQGGDSLSTSAPYGERLTIQPANGGQANQSLPGTSNGNQASALKDATVPQTIPASEAPQESAEYSYEFWMYIKDWNYNFGKEKPVFSRSVGGISNPLVVLHPTDNSLKISVSVYPNDKTSKNDPAPAGHSGSTDDVFICEIPNIPIQRWTCVSISVSTKNLDTYVDGNLVKSCLLTGVPKPALGDITINEGGGYSGWICGFNHYSKTLVPSDAQLFHSFGAPCSLPGDSYTASFGFFNSAGKQLSNYVF
jgi:hypothetical protein